MYIRKRRSKVKFLYSQIGKVLLSVCFVVIAKPSFHINLFFFFNLRFLWKISRLSER